MGSETRQVEGNILVKYLRQPNDQEHFVLPNVPTFDDLQMSSPDSSAPKMRRPSDGKDDKTPTTCSSVCRKITDACAEMFSICVKPLLRRFLTVHKRDKRGVICWILLVITFSRFVAGAVKLQSDCEKEQCVGIYLFFKGVLGLIFWSIFLVVRRLMKMERDLAKKKEEENEKNVEKKTDSDKDRNVEKQKDSNDNLFVTVYICADSLFGFGWCIVGMVWVFGNYSAMISECHGYVRDWNPAYITFAVVLTGVDLAVFLVFIIYVLCMEGCGDKK